MGPNEQNPVQPLNPDEQAALARLRAEREVREVIERELLAQARSPRRTSGGIGNTFEMLYEQFNKTKKMPPKETPQLTAELEKKLFDARNKLERENQTRHQNSRVPDAGRREQQHLDQTRRHKRDNMTALEIVHSEVPICVDELGHTKILEIVHTVRVQEIFLASPDKPIQFNCAECKLNIPGHFAYFCNGHVWCALHVPESSVCIGCRRLVDKCKKITTYDGKEAVACVGCLKNRRLCYHCKRDIGPEYIESGMCARCMDLPNGVGPYREFSRGMKWVGKKEGDVIKSNRIFSCEIEGFTKVNDWPTKLFNSLPKEVGISQDGSLRNDEGLNGFELQTPRIAGSKGEELIRHMTTAVKKVDAFVNDMCGMHVHIDGAGIVGTNRREYPVSLLQLWRTYIVFEDVILSFLPYSRRRNDFCRPIGEAFKVNDLDVIDSLAEAERFWYKERTYPHIYEAKNHRYHVSRYFGANLHSLLAHGHFEVRFHSGTLNPNKVLQWANLHALILDACAEQIMDVQFFREAQATYRIDEKAELLFERIGLAQSSRQYFHARRKNFDDKKREDEETKGTKHPRRQNQPRIEIGGLEIPRDFARPVFVPNNSEWTTNTSGLNVISVTGNGMTVGQMPSTPSSGTGINEVTEDADLTAFARAILNDELNDEQII